MAFRNAQSTDARYGTFVDLSGIQYNEYNLDCKVASPSIGMLANTMVVSYRKEVALKKLEPANMDGSRRHRVP
jgi:hypothetical protein